MPNHVVLTGPIRGTVKLKSGKVVDVRPYVVEVDSPEEAAEVAHLIGERYAAEGHPQHDPGDAFVHDVEQSRKNLAMLTGKDEA